MSAEPNLWKLLYDEDAAQKAQNLIAAAFGADKDPRVLVNEFEEVTKWLLPLNEKGDVDGDKTAHRLMHLVPALTMFARMSLDQFVTAKMSLDEDIEPDPEAVRNLAFDLLSEYAEHLRQLAGEA